MHREYEVKFLDVDPKKIESKLKKIGAIKKGNYFYRSCVFDYPGFTLDKESAWIRLRDEGDKVTLAFKRRLGVKSAGGDDDGMEEIETIVGDFETTKKFLEKIGLIVKFAQEKKRRRWIKDGVEFDIDEWPRLKPYLEIEAESDIRVGKAAEWLGLDMRDAKRFSTTQVYELNGIRDKDYKKMAFDEFVKRE